MKDALSASTSTINRNWVLKRKKKKLPSGPDFCVKGAKFVLVSSKRMLLNKRSSKDATIPERCSSKRTGNDGYYYECVICDLGGNLLCCDSCPCTYHLGCLNPPLKEIPTGKWLCPSCCQKSDQLSLDLISKHSRTEIFTSKVEMKMTGSEKLFPTIRKRKSSNKTKIVCKSRSNTKVLDSHQKVSSGPLICSEEKKPNSPMINLSVDQISDSSARDISSSRIAIFSANETAEKIPDSHCSPVSSEVGLNSRKSSPNKRKREEKTHFESRRDKSSTFTGKYVKNISKRQKSTVNSFSSSMNKVWQTVETNHEASDNVKKCSIMNEVDRILGCRAIGDSKSSLCDIYLNEPNDYSGDVLVPHKENILQDKKCGHGIDFDESGKNPVRFPTITRCCDKGGLVEYLEDFVVTSGNDSACIENMNDSPADTFAERMAAKEKMDMCLPWFDRHVGSEKYHSYKNDQEDENVEAKHKKRAEEVNMNRGLDKLARSDNKKVYYEFLIKWTGKSHLHNSWISEGEIRVLAKRKLENYKVKYGLAQMDNCDERWKLPQRVIALRSVEDGSSEAFIKWTGLPYDECTWEKLDEPAIVKSVHLIDSFNQFEWQALGKDAVALDVCRIDDCHRGDIGTLKEQPMYLKGGSLFPHQLEALNWLRTCWHKSKNVILADEMGLGKTVSACAFLSSIYFDFNATLPSLVLIPLSTMPNWLSEFSLWSPNLNVVEYHGCAKARSIIRQYEWHACNRDGPKKAAHYKFNVLLTTYEMVLADSSHLHGVPWEVLLVDEGHRLKNSGSKLFSLLNTFSFRHRVLLTGTPLQNNIGEMYNLLNFLQPASFPSLSSFEEKFIDLTIAEKIEELKRLVAPHMLRRLKKDTMQNIPPKIERMVPVELSSIQAEFYRAMLTKNYQVLRNIGKGVPHQSMLNIVMQLRKVCNHPYLIPGTEPDSGSLEFLHEMRIKASAKLTVLHSMLKVLYKEGHKVLIFSQMTKLLDILEDYLAVEYGPKTYERVDGSVSVSDRQAAIARFNQDKSRFVFLLSTRSCGLGINLATADTVIIYDSDFNPHADIQAMNRAHRIGQSNRLLVYRLVVRASVEERILQLAKKKLVLDQLFVKKSGTPKEVEDILKWGTEQLFDVPGMEKSVRANCISNDDVITDMEYKHKRRTGGLGDVYNDKCADNSSGIVWSESAIVKLLDRSSMHFGGSDAAEADSVNDMLGSLKFIEWNDELSNEQTRNESSPLVTDNLTSQISVKDHDFVADTQENEWDTLLRVRWEKYQNEEEAVLGRGKRLRKVVSYKEDYAPHKSETVSEVGEHECEAADEQEREYTASGRAFKIKFAKLRARQKERLLQRHRESYLKELPEHDSMSQIPSSKTGDHQPAPYVETGRAEVPTPGFSSTELLQSSGRQKYSEYISPALSHTAQNPNKIESTGKIFCKRKTWMRSVSMGPELPFDMVSSGEPLDPNTERQTRHIFHPPAVSMDFSSQITGCHGNTCHLNDYSIQRAVCDHVKGSGFRQKMELPELPFDGKLPPIHAQYTSTANSKILPYMSLPTKTEPGKGFLPALPAIPFFSSPMFPFHGSPLYNLQYSDVDHVAGLGYRMGSVSPFTENHQQVLDDLITRMGSDSNNMFRRRASTVWSDDELDSLWVGVRRHGRGNWDSMLRDPRLKFSCYKISADLGLKWEVEELKVLGENSVNAPESYQQLNSVKFSSFPGISGQIMEHALHRNSLGEFSAFRSLRTGDYPHFEPSEKFMPLPRWNADKTWSSNFRDSSSGPSIHLVVSPNYCTGSSLLLNSKNTTEMSSDGMNYLKQKEEMQDDRICRTFNRAAGFSGDCSTKNNLPHWLRDAVGAPSNTLNPALPTSMSAITHTLDLCGDDRPIFPPFGGFGPPRPSDPHPTLRHPISESSSGNRGAGIILPSPKGLQQIATPDVPFPPVSSYMRKINPEPMPELTSAQSVEVVRDVNTGEKGSGESSETQSDQARTTLSNVHEISSEGTISDDNDSGDESHPSNGTTR